MRGKEDAGVMDDSRVINWVTRVATTAVICHLLNLFNKLCFNKHEVIQL